MIRRSHLIVYVREQAAARDFWTAVLGPPRLDVPGMTEYALGPDSVLGLMPAAGISRLLGEEIAVPPVAAELYLVVDDAAAAHARALAAGAVERSPVQPRSWGDRAGYLSAPDGVILAFAEPG